MLYILHPPIQCIFIWLKSNTLLVKFKVHQKIWRPKWFKASPQVLRFPKTYILLCKHHNTQPHTHIKRRQKCPQSSELVLCERLIGKFGSSQKQCWVHCHPLYIEGCNASRCCQSIVKSPEKCYGSSLPHQNHRGRLKKVWWVEWSSWKWQHSFTIFCGSWLPASVCNSILSSVHNIHLVVDVLRWFLWYTIYVEGSLLLLEDLGIGIQVAKSSELRCANLCAL